MCNLNQDISHPETMVIKHTLFFFLHVSYLCVNICIIEGGDQQYAMKKREVEMRECVWGQLWQGRRSDFNPDVTHTLHH